jgi:bifunctional DNA-binding transcriptional regulator/antitoxin component of YhaV-PrlF toxin-antitoxin module
MKEHNFENGFVPIWKKSKVDDKGRCVLPQKLRRELGLNGKSTIL